MGLIDRLRRRASVPDDAFSPMPGFRIVYGEVTRFVADTETLGLVRDGHAQRTAQEQFFVLDMLAEDGRATACEDGFAVPAEEVARLEDDDAELLGLPPRFSGELSTAVHKWTASLDFRIDLNLRVGAHPVSPDRRGPVILVDGSLLRVSLPLLRSLRALDDHASLSREARTEAENVRLVARLQAAHQLATDSDDASARDDHFQLSLGALDRFSTVVPRGVGLTVELQGDGSLTVEPDIGPGVDRALLGKRWHQLDRRQGFSALQPSIEGPAAERSTGAVVRADDALVLLEPEQLVGIQEVRDRPRIPADEVAQFLLAPGAYYDPDLVDVDVRFSVRVAGLGVIAPLTFAEAASSGLDWFATLGHVSEPESLAEIARNSSEQKTIESNVAQAWEHGDTVVTVREQIVDITDHSRVEDAFIASRARIAGLLVESAIPGDDAGAPGRQVTVGMHILEAVDAPDALRARAASAAPEQAVDYARLSRTPFPHQVVGADWMTGLMQSALSSAEDDPTRIQGALLADDMGLGKTYMTLVALAEAHRAQLAHGRVPLPMLAVMPVALLENWLQELASTFGSAHGPFDDVVVLQGPGLADYRLRGATRETAARVDDLDAAGMVRADRIHATLRIGTGWEEARLDRPGVLVLTTYETLRRYQVSLGLVEWGVVVFDEAQATKNPEILATRAAKGLKARFKLLATGTPVENSLRDFWSLIDTAQPGLLGPWANFHDAWIVPMEEATPEEHQRLGRALRATVGSFMLRRVKEDHLPDLPAKHIHEYPQVMPAIQFQAYDDVLTAHRGRAGAKGAALKTLHELGAVSLHPGLLAGRLPSGAEGLDESARTLVTVRVILDAVRVKNEKVIVFAKSKEIQRALALWLLDRYDLRVDVVNGDTAATGVGGETRMGKIRTFEARDGFNVIIMSPLAAGVGLTVVGANHAVHLERHWNPAKEAQATDRIYRIGQKREVHVHYPMALHPDLESFDVKLDRLLRTKVALKDAVVVPQEVKRDELERALGLT
ncbi:Helicase conserved C-terminal domain-containing protein [Sanguibacter gelidistatuariae]|uniref:Helicase conserved C-terminal domain-containing protein n=1 Tax=Sanguibacter gelidistatuariae TaxID=1814289 RepID=A0A1G6L6I0_9MICO|nr:DEAD/DEAH box helicase [Sanguibacter gelidistatuariae]SDC38922.1 Helicase conserved C-terminal domain-containing protein [Sanguibacter gelidistatuariae]